MKIKIMQKIEKKNKNSQTTFDTRYNLGNPLGENPAGR
jgi:hypothetical protein